MDLNERGSNGVINKTNKGTTASLASHKIQFLLFPIGLAVDEVGDSLPRLMKRAISEF
jgi:hypothetical protein